MGKALAIGSRVILGLVFFVFGLNFFFHFLPMPLPPPNSPAGLFMGALMQTKYFFPLLKITETVCGLMLLTGIFMPLALVILSPIVINIFMVHFFLDQSGLPMAITLVVLMIVQGKLHWKRFQGLFDTKF
jgi:uncharacterized membrane protein YphA (DoxX/SURF4 family)